MSQENMEIVKRRSRHFPDAELDAVASHPDVELDWSRSRGVEAGIYRGREATRHFWNTFFETFDRIVAVPEEIIDHGDYVILLDRTQMRGRDGIEVEARNVSLVTLRDGQIVQWRLCRDRAEALEAAGLAEQAVSQKNAETVRRWFETWNRGDLDSFIDLYAIDAELTPPESWVETATVKGRADIRRFFEGLREAWEGRDTAVLLELIESGDLVISRMDWQVRGRVSGIVTNLAITNVNRIASGKIISQRHYLDHTEALKAVGLQK